MLEKQRDLISQEMYEKYDFGSGVVVTDSEGWGKDGTSDFTKIVYVEFDDEPSEASHRISFHVKFKDNSEEVEDVYGLLMSNGSEIGHLPKAKTAAKLKK